MIISLSFLSLGDKKKKGEEAALPELSDSEAEGEGAGEKACKLEFKASVSCSLWGLVLRTIFVRIYFFSVL
jgi:hypothetical protein